MIVEKIAPPLIANFGGFLGRPDDVGEENRGKDSVNWDRGP
ncbi:hypothetical protein ACVWVY_008705 [Bradyrhizobium sp. URHC0002]